MDCMKPKCFRSLLKCGAMPAPEFGFKPNSMRKGLKLFHAQAGVTVISASYGVVAKSRVLGGFTATGVPMITIIKLLVLCHIYSD